MIDTKLKSSIRSISTYGGWNMLGPGSSTIKSCGLVGIGVVLMEKVCHCGVGV